MIIVSDTSPIINLAVIGQALARRTQPFHTDPKGLEKLSGSFLFSRFQAKCHLQWVTAWRGAGYFFTHSQKSDLAFGKLRLPPLAGFKGRDKPTHSYIRPFVYF
jgi:hypothetical protein